MKRIGTTSLSICASLSLLTVAIACGSGSADPDAAGNAGNGSGNSSSGGSGNTGNTSSGGSSGSGNTGGGTTTGSVCDDVTRSLAMEPYVDNFETDVRFGGWYAFSDTTPANVPPMREGPGALETSMAIHVSATGITTPTSMPEAGYGAGVGFNLVNTAMGEDCVDVSAFDGISFWAKGTSGTANSVIFQIVHPGTQPADGMPPGDCTVPAQCYLHPKKNITLTADWTHYTVTWDELTGSTFEVTGPILGFNIITPDTEWDIWIDEVTFFSGTAPETPVNPPEAGAGGAGGAGG